MHVVAASRRAGVGAPLAVGGTVIVGYWDGRLLALDPATGPCGGASTRMGPIKAGAALAGRNAPTVLGSLVYFSSYESNRNARRTFAVDAVTGRLAWSVPDGEYSPVVSDGIRVYLTGYTTLYALAH